MCFYHWWSTTSFFLYDPSIVTKYIGRYLVRPVIATSRIDNYDGDNVTFHYNRHEDDELITETIPILDFIKRLIQHIPEKHFKQIRYYGIYARHRKSDQKLNRAISKSKHTINHKRVPLDELYEQAKSKAHNIRAPIAS